MVIGNELSKNQTELAIFSGLSPILLYGPDGVGKRTHTEALLKSKVDCDDSINFISDETSLEDFKYVISHSNTFNDNPYYIIIDNVDILSDSKKDFLLKHTEEHDERCKYILIATDSSLMNPSLESRIRLRIKWFPIDRPLLGKDSISAYISQGSYSVYNAISNDRDIHDLYDALLNKDWPTHAIYNILPKSIQDYKSYSDIRKKGVIYTIYAASKKSKYKKQLLELVRDLHRIPSLNIGHHYLNTAFQLVNS